MTIPDRKHHGLFKAKVIKFLGPWKSVGQAGWETLSRRSAQRNGSAGMTHPPAGSTGHVTSNKAEKASCAA